MRSKTTASVHCGKSWAGPRFPINCRVIHNLLDRVDVLLIGGAMAYTFMLAEGKSIGDSLSEPNCADIWPESWRRSGIIEPGWCFRSITSPRQGVGVQHQDHEGNGETILKKKQTGGDIGPHRQSVCRAKLRRPRPSSGTAPWARSRPSRPDVGTKEVALAIVRATLVNGATTIIHGGDSGSRSAGTVCQEPRTCRTSRPAGGASLEAAPEGAHSNSVGITLRLVAKAFRRCSPNSRPNHRWRSRPSSRSNGCMADECRDKRTRGLIFTCGSNHWMAISYPTRRWGLTGRRLPQVFR